MNALEPLFPALRRLEPLGLPPTFQGWYAAASAGQAGRLARHLSAEFAALAAGQAGDLAGGLVDQAYLRSAAFQANVVQAVRAAEIAESEEKLRFIARALAGCALAFPAPAVDKVQTMRIVEGLSVRELSVMAGVYDLLDPLEPYADALPLGARSGVPGLSQQEWEAGLLGLAGLGLLSRETQAARLDDWPLNDGMGAELPARQVWKLTLLARQVALLVRLQVV